jgi:hypothetical protein
VSSGHIAQQTISVAESLLRWYQSPTDDLPTLNTLMPQQLAADVYCVRGVNFARFFQNYLKSPQFESIRQEILKTWGAFSGCLTHADAKTLLLSHAQLSDYSPIYWSNFSFVPIKLSSRRENHTPIHAFCRRANILKTMWLRTSASQISLLRAAFPGRA